MRRCPDCGSLMEQSNPQDDSPIDSWECMQCDHVETDDNAEDFNPDDEL